jgi:PTH2 family peptidyl-tRNA hydrolase
MKSKQVIVIRKDLNMRKGKMVAQGAHASMKAILDSMIDVEEEKVLYLEPGTPMEDWINGIFTKICVSVDSEEELLELYNNAKIQGYNAALIQDAGLTEFGGVPTYTCCAIGPNWEDEVNAITGHLKLL